MTEQGPDQVELDLQLQIGTDTFGDPIIRIKLGMPPGYAMSPEVVEELALKLLAAAATTRTRAGILRHMVLDGIPEVDARRMVDRYMSL